MIHGDARGFFLWQPIAMISDYSRVLWIASEVGVLPWVIEVVVQLLVSRVVTDVAPSFGSHSMVARPLVHQRGSDPFAIGVFQHGYEAETVVVRFWGEPCQF